MSLFSPQSFFVLSRVLLCVRQVRGGSAALIHQQTVLIFTNNSEFMYLFMYALGNIGSSFY